MKKIIVKNKGHYLENYENRGDVIFLFTLKKEELDYKIDKNKTYSISVQNGSRSYHNDILAKFKLSKIKYQINKYFVLV